MPAAHLTKTTKSAKPGDIERRWYIVDAEGQNLGRLATVIAETLRGKRSPFFTPHTDCGDFVVVVNADKIAVTGNKMDDKLYWRHSGYPGGIRKRTLREQLERVARLRRVTARQAFGDGLRFSDAAGVKIRLRRAQIRK